MVGGFLGPVGELKIEEILSRRERQHSLVTEHLVLDRVEALFGKRIGNGFSLRKNEPVVCIEDAHADFDGVGITGVSFLGHA